MQKTDVVIIGGGPAGMAAAISCSNAGAKCMLIERDYRLGGILNQCIHNGFGLHYFKQELTGPEYAARFEEKLKQTNALILLNTFVTEIELKSEHTRKQSHTKNGQQHNAAKKIVTIISQNGLEQIETKAIILAMGCRERAAGAIFLAGDRPAGIFTAGLAQKIINCEGRSIGKKAVILGSGDIGLIMARRLVCEGTPVAGVFEIMPSSSGLKRNIAQCLNDYNIPLHLNTTISRVIGKQRIEAVEIVEVNADLSFKNETRRIIECDTLLLSVGLIPENDLVTNLSVEFCPLTGGATTDEFGQTSAEGIFSCGNVMHVHDLVDNVSYEAEKAGKYAAAYAKGKLQKSTAVKVLYDKNIRYVQPETLYAAENTVTSALQKVLLFFRVNSEMRNVKIVVTCSDKVIAQKACLIVTPGEMQEIEIEKAKITGSVTVSIQPLT